MSNLKKFSNQELYDTFMNSSNIRYPNVSYILNGNNVIYNDFPEPSVGDIAYYDNTCIRTVPPENFSYNLGSPVGVVVIPRGFTPDGKARIMLRGWLDAQGYITVNSSRTITFRIDKLSNVPIYNALPTINEDSYGDLPSDVFTEIQSNEDPIAFYKDSTKMLPSPYLGDRPNPDYYKKLSSKENALSDFDGSWNTQALVDLGGDTCGPAWVACNVKNNTGNVKWYLPAIGELGYIMPRLGKINKTLKKFFSTEIPTQGCTIWSSTCAYSTGMYALHVDTGRVSGQFIDKSYLVRPFAILE